MRPWIRNTLFVLGVIVLALGMVVFVVSRPLPAEARALAAMNSNDTVTVTNTDSRLVFMPKQAATKGLIFYQGARVAPEAYAEALAAIAKAGYLVVVPKMPLNFAVFNPNAADSVMADYPQISFAVAGHSLGGAMACSYANSSKKITTLIFWAAYCDKSFDISQSQIKVVSISGQKDGLATPDKIRATKAFAPSSAKYIEIKGMNHAQFGDYGEQSGDAKPDISNEAATQAVIAATLEALR